MCEQDFKELEREKKDNLSENETEETLPDFADVIKKQDYRRNRFDSA